MPELRELDPVAAGLIHASLTEDKFATDRILTRAVEANLDGLFFGFTMANLAGWLLVYASPSHWRPQCVTITQKHRHSFHGSACQCSTYAV